MVDPVQLMTYNVRQALDSDGDNAWKHRREAVANTIRFHRPDLIGCQEVHYEQLEYLRNQLPDYRWVGSGRLDGERDGEFCPIGFRRERYEAQSVHTFWLSEEPETPGSIGWDAAYTRIVTIVELADNESNKPIVHVNTHFDNEGTKARKAGAHLLLERTASIADGSPIVMTGDFNCTVDSAPYQLLINEATPLDLFDSRAVSEHSHHGPETTRTNFDTLVLDQAIDFVFVTGEWSVSQHGVGTDLDTRGRFPSDHLPVVADAAVEHAGT